MARVTKIFLGLMICPLLLWGASTEIELDNNLVGIERRINELKQQLKKEDLQKEKAEVESQGYMIDNWNAYGGKIEEIKKIEDHQNSLYLEIQALEKQKAKILDRSSTSQFPKLN